MAKIYRLTDRIKVKVDDIIITISPLSIQQKSEVEAEGASGGSAALLKASLKALKYAIKDIEGLENAEGSAYKLEFDPDGSLSDACLDDLFNVQQSLKLITIALNLVNNIPDEFYDPVTGVPLDGVSFVKSKEPARKKSKVVSGN